MTVLGYVIIEYNQASRWPDLHLDVLYDTPAEAEEVAEAAREEYKELGRGERFTIAEVKEL